MHVSTCTELLTFINNIYNNIMPTVNTTIANCTLGLGGDCPAQCPRSGGTSTHSRPLSCHASAGSHRAAGRTAAVWRQKGIRGRKMRFWSRM